ncbi:MAG: hypothetical protein SXV54_01725 [Chloroflexota bacterium]|nr:hypothetical protein [Chloroflexota bacterium]
MKLNWSCKTTWLGLMALLLATGTAWIALRKVPTEGVVLGVVGYFYRRRFPAAENSRGGNVPDAIH